MKNLAYTFIFPSAFLIFLYFFFPQGLPTYFNKDLKNLSTQIYVTSIGVQSNSVAIALCQQYPSRFLELQAIAVNDKIKLLRELKYLDHVLPGDLAELQKRTEKSDSKIEYYKKTLETLNANMTLLEKNYGHPEYCD